MKNGDWASGEASGELRGDNGFLILWDAAAFLAAVLKSRQLDPVDVTQLSKPSGSKVSRLPTAAERIRSAPKGTRHTTVNREGFIAGLHNDAEAKEQIATAAEEILKDDPDWVERTIEDSYAAGVGASANADFSEDAFALRMQERQGGSIIAAPGGEWVYFEDSTGLWVADEGAHRIRKYLSVLIRRHILTYGDDKAQKREIKGASRNAFVSGALALAKDKLFDPEVEFDANPDVVGLPGGELVELPTGKVRRSERGDFLTKTLGVIPAKGDCPRFDAYLEEALPNAEIREFVLAWLGYTLTGHTQEEAFIFAYGERGTGKSTLASLMSFIHGAYGDTVRGDNIAGDWTSHLEWLARLKGKRFVLVSELPRNGGRWKTADLNDLISGDAKIAARYMRQNTETWYSVTKLMVLGNDKPIASPASGLFRRMQLIGFEHKPRTEDKELKQTLRGEAPQVLAKLLVYAKRWYKDALTPPETIKAATEEYRSDQADMGLEDAIKALEANDTGNGIPLSLITRNLEGQGIRRNRTSILKELRGTGWQHSTHEGVRVWRAPF